MRAEELLERLQEPERKAAATGEALKSLWRPEYSSYCIEGTPGAPYCGQINCFNEVELNMKFRRDEVEKLLQDDEILVSMSIFPRLGVNPFTVPPSKPGRYFTTATRSAVSSRTTFFCSCRIYIPAWQYG